MAISVRDFCKTEVDSDPEFDLVIDEDYFNREEDENNSIKNDRNLSSYSEKLLDGKQNLSEPANYDSEELPVDLSVSRDKLKDDRIKKEFAINDAFEQIDANKNTGNNNDNTGDLLRPFPLKLNAKSYTCDLCDEIFRYNVALICHLNIVHNIKFGYHDSTDEDDKNNRNSTDRDDDNKKRNKSTRRKLNRSVSSSKVGTKPPKNYSKGRRSSTSNSNSTLSKKVNRKSTNKNVSKCNKKSIGNTRTNLDELGKQDGEEFNEENERLVQIKVLDPDCSADKQTQTNNNCSSSADDNSETTGDNVIRFICSKCNKSYSDNVNKQRLIRHAKICRKQFRYSCHICTMKFSWELKLKKHLYRKHNQTEVFLCHLCCKVFVDDSALTTHREECSKTVDTYPDKVPSNDLITTYGFRPFLVRTSVRR